MGAGRPRSFEKNEALDAAMEVFWRKGYEGASMVDLTTAMGINSPSLYAAFGNKKELFKAVLDHYNNDRAGFLAEVLDQPTARAAAERFLYGVVDHVTDPNDPPGCLLVQSGLTCGDEASGIPTELAQHRAATELTLRERFECAKGNNELPKGSSPAALARYLVTMGNGLAVQAASGVPRKDLRQIAKMALDAFPTSVEPTVTKAPRKKAMA